MTKSAEHLDQAQRSVSVPEPSATSAADGLEKAREMARRYLPDNVNLFAAIAFGDSDATLWTRLHAGRLIAQIAGAIPETVPEAPQPRGDGNAHA